MTRLAQVAITAVLIAGGVAVAYFHATAVGQCLTHNLQDRQTIIDANFHAEYAKVAGQVRGLKLLRGNAAKSLPPRPLAGIDQFIRASEHYLAVIKRENTYSQAHPLGDC